MANIPVKEQPKNAQISRASSGASSRSPPVPERAQSLSKTPSRRETLPLLPPPPEGDTEARLQLVLHELEEAKARTAQMEKTMRFELLYL